MIPHAEKILVSLPQGHGDVDPEEMERERKGERGERDSFIVCSFYLSKKKKMIPPLYSFESRVENPVTVANITLNSVFQKAELVLNWTSDPEVKANSLKMASHAGSENRSRAPRTILRARHYTGEIELNQCFSKLGVVLSSRGHWQCLEIFLAVTTRWGVLLTSSGWRPAMLLNTLRRTGWPLQQRKTPPQMFRALGLRNSELNSSHPIHKESQSKRPHRCRENKRPNCLPFR